MELQNEDCKISLFDIGTVRSPLVVGVRAKHIPSGLVAECSAHRNAHANARDAALQANSNQFFGDRPQIDTNDRRVVYRAGFHAAWQTQMLQIALPKRPEPGVKVHLADWLRPFDSTREGTYSGQQMLEYGRACAEAQRLTSLGLEYARDGLGLGEVQEEVLECLTQEKDMTPLQKKALKQASDELAKAEDILLHTDAGELGSPVNLGSPSSEMWILIQSIKEWIRFVHEE